MLKAGNLLVLPATRWFQGILRAAQCPVTDPVSFAVLAGRPAALFTDAPGRSPRDWARRAVTEHRAWLAAGDPLSDTFWAGPQPSIRTASREGVGRLLTAARAALFQVSVDAGEPTLAVSLDEVAARLGSHVGAEALAAYEAGEVEQALSDELARLVRGLPPYA